MIKLTFNDDMIKIIGSMTGKTFKSYETDEKIDFSIQAMRFNMGKFAINLFNEEKTVDFGDYKEDMACFTCEQAALTDEFPYKVRTKAYMIDEKILKVSIVRDVINVNNHEYDIEYDMAIAIETACHTYIFSRGLWFDEGIYISADKNTECVYDIEKVKSDWSDNGQKNVSVERIVVNT